VIAFVILRGRLPFEARHKKAIVHMILNEEPTMSTEDPLWKLISPQGIELVRQLLTKEPDKRPSVSKALKHPWFSQCEKQHMNDFDFRKRALSRTPSTRVSTRSLSSVETKLNGFELK